MISSVSKPYRQYVGSAVNYKSRISGHITRLNKHYHHSKTLQRHFNKYGIEDLKFEILEIVKDRSLLLTAEQSFIDMFKPYFNTNPIAGSNLGTKFGPMPEYHKQKISKSSKGHKKSAECRAAHYVKMHKYSIDGELLKTYESGTHAMKAEGIRTRRAIGANSTIGGFVWVSENFPLPDFKALKQRLISSKKVLCKPVLQIDKSGKLIKEFEGVRIACKETGIDHRSISQVAAGSAIRKNAGGFKWEYKK